LQGADCKVKTKTGHTVTASALVVATNTPVNDRVIIHSKQMAYRTYVIGVEIPRDAIEPILLWDDYMPYHYVRSMRSKETGANDLLIVGGEDHKTGQYEEGGAPFGRLEHWTRERYPMVGEVKFRWSGQVMEPYDKLGYIGRNPADEKNVFVITGDSGNGMTHGTIAGILCTDLIMGRKNDWETLYDPKRKTLSASLEYTKENLNTAAQYRDWLARGDVASANEIPSGTGAILRRGLKHVAAYRDADGVLHEKSAVCPHLGCIVRWNHVEKTWDCPCHGSRFNPTGKVLNGPSLGDLNEV
jgi:nitrite reductase/ring-hydroxylating ferredoxin subunit